jgi:26S proteasome regulatory subunit N5
LASGNWTLLGAQVSALAKKRGLLKQSMSRMFQTCLEHVNALPDRDSKEALLRCVRQHTEGKVYVEIERAQATRLLAAMCESEGRLKDAFELMLEVAVETFGSMPRHEKYDFILEQMRLALATDQHSQAQIISRKINPKIFVDNVEEDFQVHWWCFWAGGYTILTVCRS